MQFTRSCVSAVFVIWLAATAVAQDKTKETQTLESKAETAQRAKFVDFSGELGLSISSLDNLGDRIDQARLASDPVELAVSATLLQAAEGVADKQASLTSKALVEEAIELAKLRSNPAELSTVARLIDGDASQELQELAEVAAEEQSSEEGEVTKDLDGDLIVDNHSHSELHIYVNGYEVGHVHPHSVRRFHVHHVHHVTARDHYGHRWHRHFEGGHYHYYRWVIHPPHHHH